MVRYISEDEDDFLTIQESAPSAHLSLLVEGRVSHSFPLRGEVRLGREKDNTIVVADQKVSRHHATLKPLDDSFIIQDEGSANGTYVNGVQLAQPTRLHRNDKITLGDTTFLFTTTRPDPTTIEPAKPAVAAASPAQPQASSPIPLPGHNMPIWLVIGCMAAAIIALLIILAMMFGLFLGRGQLLGLAMLWLSAVLF